jgi:hypothetical protein
VPRPELFDRAVAQALLYAQRLGALEVERDPVVLRSVLELWYLKTRFAYRIPMDDVVEVLLEYPGPGHQWSGGRGGEWRRSSDHEP